MIESTAVMVFFVGMSFGIAFGLMAVFWREKKPANYDPPYFKGNGEPQPGEWSPDLAFAPDFRVYNSRAEWARAKGLM